MVRKDPEDGLEYPPGMSLGVIQYEKMMRAGPPDVMFDIFTAGRPCKF